VGCILDEKSLQFALKAEFAEGIIARYVWTSKRSAQSGAGIYVQGGEVRAATEPPGLDASDL
jgi:hypothetical protein